MVIGYKKELNIEANEKSNLDMFSLCLNSSKTSVLHGTDMHGIVVHQC